MPVIKREVKGNSLMELVQALADQEGVNWLPDTAEGIGDILTKSLERGRTDEIPFAQIATSHITLMAIEMGALLAYFALALAPSDDKDEFLKEMTADLSKVTLMLATQATKNADPDKKETLQ